MDSLFERLNGFETLEKVHKLFYDKIYAHPWLKDFFTDHKQTLLESQQTTFMASKMGGPNVYSGKTPKYAHQNMFVTDEIFNLRSVLLKQSILELAIPKNLCNEWIELDNKFRNALVKNALNQCVTSYTAQQIINIQKPLNL